MVTIVNKGKCAGCHACANACPRNCINMVRDIEGFEYPVVDEGACVHCNLCNSVCPIETTQLVSGSTTVYAAVNQDEGIRLASSSGGVFTLLAERILSEGGVVFGAAFSEDFHSAHHIAIESSEELGRLRGSKYLQSRIGDTYREVRAFLEQGRSVLFSGTPCQIAGLKAYLGKEYDTLYTQDIICHGVPSPLVWDKYLVAREKESQSATRWVSFRNKENSWKSYQVQIIFENSAEYKMAGSEDLYMKGFLLDIFLRPSCYNCAFKGVERTSDVTLADFWGIQHMLPQMDDDKGTSLIMVHSAKGEELIERIRHRIRITEANIMDAMEHNPSAIKASAIPVKRDKFFSDVYRFDILQVLRRYTTTNSLIRCLRRLKRKATKIIECVKQCRGRFMR